MNKDNKQEELINKIKEIIEETKYHDDYYENNCEIEKEKLKNILDLIKEYEENNETYIYINNINNSFFTDY